MSLRGVELRAFSKNLMIRLAEIQMMRIVSKKMNWTK